MSYIACHESAADIIGPGVTHAVAEFVEGTRDPNQYGQPRLDFIIYRIDGTRWSERICITDWCRILVDDFGVSDYVT